VEIFKFSIKIHTFNHFWEKKKQSHTSWKRTWKTGEWPAWKCTSQSINLKTARPSDACSNLNFSSIYFNFLAISMKIKKIRKNKAKKGKKS
jgi:hypothetical protein